MNDAIRLLYFDGCPNVEQARGNLRSALARAGLNPAWKEINVQAEEIPDNWRGFPSPTVLIDGKDVLTGAGSAAGSAACRVGGAPSIETIIAALGGARRKPWLASLGVMPAVLFGALPAFSCPLCYPALAGLLSALGMLGINSTAALRPLMGVFLALAVSGLFFQARRAGRYAPLGLGAAAAVGIYFGMFVLGSSTLKALSIGLLLAASIWNVLPMLRKVKISEGCSSCRSDKEGG